MFEETSPIWHYMSPEQQSLARDGKLLIADHLQHPNEKIGDYSYLVFPFSKLYEGFLKQLFRDLKIISENDYRSDHYRIGRSLSPNLVNRLGENSAYGEVERRYGKELADRLWYAWKEGRNLVFHYFPHNFRALDFKSAEGLIHLIYSAMEDAIEKTKVIGHHVR